MQGVRRMCRILVLFCLFFPHLLFPFYVTRQTFPSCKEIGTLYTKNKLVYEFTIIHLIKEEDKACPLIFGVACPLIFGVACPLIFGVACPLYFGVACPLYFGVACPLYFGVACPLYFGVVSFN